MQKSVDPRLRFAGPSAQPEDDDGIDLLSILRTLWRGKFLIAVCGLVAMLIGGWYAFGVAVPTYQATVQMALQMRAESVVDVESVISGVSSDQASINTEMEVIRSRELLSRLVAELDLLNDPEFNRSIRPDEGFGFNDLKATIRSYIPGQLTGPVEPLTDEMIYNDVIDSVRDAVETRIERMSYVFTISATAQSKARSALLANTLARIYRDDQIGVKVEATEKAAVWLSARVSELQSELEAQQSEINTLRASNTLVSRESLEALNVQSVELSARLEEAERTRAQARERVQPLASAKGLDVAVRAGAAADAQLRTLAEDAAAGDAAALVRFDRRYEQLVLQAEGELIRLDTMVEDLREQAERLAAVYDEQSAELVTIEQKEREADATRVLYETFLTRLKETTVQSGVHQADSRILSEATPGELVAPRKTLLIALSAVLGLIAGCGIVLLREMMQNTYRTAEDLETRTGTTVLGQIPKIATRTRPETIAYLAEKPTSAAAEAVRNLRTSVLLSNVDNPPQVIMSTSSIPGEGKTTLAISLAQNLAGLGKKVILIEGDIRRRTFGVYFPEAMENGGLLSVISGKVPLAAAAYPHPKLKIDVLMGEKSSINAADVFSSEAFRHLIEQLRAAYDYVVIDSPPVLVVPDARVIGQLVDAVVYSVNWDRTTKSQVEDGLKQFRSVNVRVTGLVLSQIDPRGMKRYGYGNQYGAYSRYGKAYYDT